MVAWLLSAFLLGPAVAQECPDPVAAIQAAYDAAMVRDTSNLARLLETAEDGMACGPIIDHPRTRARFWLAYAVQANEDYDKPTTDKALYAAWKAWPDAPVDGLTGDLQRRFREADKLLIERPASFRMDPMPDPRAFIYIDGKAASAEALHQPGGVLQTTNGVHIVQMVAGIDAVRAMAARVADFQGDVTSSLNIYERNRRRVRSDIDLGDLSRGPSGGCAGRR